MNEKLILKIQKYVQKHYISDDLDFDLDPEDIDAKDSVTVVFEIK